MISDLHGYIITFPCSKCSEHLCWMTQHHVPNLGLSHLVFQSMQLLKGVDFPMMVGQFNWDKNIHFLYKRKKQEG